MQKKSPKLLIPLLIASGIMIMFSGMINNVAVFAWLWPGCMLYFTRHTAKRWLPVAWLVYVAAFSVFNYDPLNTGSFAITVAFNSLMVLICFLPFVADRFLQERLPGAVSTLIFPLGIAAEEFLFSLTHVSVMNNLAYTQVGNAELIQSASVIGTYGLSALIAACASVAVYCIDAKFEWRVIRRPACIYLALLLLANIYGGFRMAFETDLSETVKVALANGPVIDVLENGEWEVASYEENLSILTEAFEQAADSRAELIAFNEEGFTIADVEEASFTEEIRALVMQTGMAAMVPLEVYDTDGDTDELSWNKLIYMDTEGNILVDYEKTMLVPVIETSYYIEGDGELPCVTTEIGGKTVKLAMDVCYDGDFPSYIRTMDSDVDIWFEPCWEWEPVNQSHTNGHIFRCIENGVNMIKPTYLGYSVVADYKGSVLAKSGEVARDVLIADVPVNGVTTVYGTIGCVLDWVYVAGFVAVALAALLKKRAR